MPSTAEGDSNPDPTAMLEDPMLTTAGGGGQHHKEHTQGTSGNKRQAISEKIY
jgi:hypothetical protein